MILFLFVLKIVIAAAGFCFALAYFVKYMEGKNKEKLWRAAIFFFGSWIVLVLIKLFEVWFYKR
jgi:hypothetical protein